MGYVSIDEVVAMAQTVIKTSDNYDRNIYRQWCYNALLDLGLADDEIKVCEIIPHNSIALLPPDCRQIIEVSLFNSAGCQLLHKYRTGTRRMYTNKNLIPSATAGTTDEAINNSLPVDVSNDATNIYLGTNGDNVSTIGIRYFAYPIDQNGAPKVRDEDTMACVYFIRYMTALREDDNRSKIAQDQMNWFRESDRARARKKMASMTPDKARSIMMSMMKVVPNFSALQDY